MENNSTILSTHNMHVKSKARFPVARNKCSRRVLHRRVQRIRFGRYTSSNSVRTRRRGKFPQTATWLAQLKPSRVPDSSSRRAFAICLCRARCAGLLQWKSARARSSVSNGDYVYVACHILGAPETLRHQRSSSQTPAQASPISTAEDISNILSTVGSISSASRSTVDRVDRHGASDPEASVNSKLQNRLRDKLCFHARSCE